MKSTLLFVLGGLIVLSAQPVMAAAIPLEGQLIQGGLIYGYAAPGQQVYYRDHRLQLSADGLFIVGFGRDAEPEQQLVIVHQGGRQETLRLKLKPRQYKIERINGISKKMLNPGPDEMKRIAHEAGLVAEARRRTSPLQYFREQFIWPVTGRISGVYGSQRIFNGEPRRPHYGIDIATAKGTPVIAPTGGTVSLIHNGMFFSGATLIIDHGHGLSSSFLHLDRILVKTGDTVARGQKIATVGASGRVTGPHLDWRVNWFDQRLDPALLVSEMPGNRRQ